MMDVPYRVIIPYSIYSPGSIIYPTGGQADMLMRRGLIEKVVSEEKPKRRGRTRKHEPETKHSANY